MIEPEYITIIEGPTPEFQSTPEFAINSVLEGPHDSFTAYCELRTANGEAILERCRRAWKEKRPVRLDFPDEMRMRKELDVVGLRLKERDEGTVLQLWVRHPLNEHAAEDDDFDDFDDDDNLSFG